MKSEHTLTKSQWDALVIVVDRYPEVTMSSNINSHDGGIIHSGAARVLEQLELIRYVPLAKERRRGWGGLPDQWLPTDKGLVTRKLA